MFFALKTRVSVEEIEDCVNEELQIPFLSFSRNCDFPRLRGYAKGGFVAIVYESFDFQGRSFGAYLAGRVFKRDSGSAIKCVVIPYPTVFMVCTLLFISAAYALAGIGFFSGGIACLVMLLFAVVLVSARYFLCRKKLKQYAVGFLESCSIDINECYFKPKHPVLLFVLLGFGFRLRSEWFWEGNVW